MIHHLSINRMIAPAVILAGLFTAISIITGQHAEERHGFADAQLIRSCVQDEANILQVWLDPCTKRLQLVCKPNESYAIMIVEAVGDTFREVTCFFKEKMPDLEKIGNYLRNRGSARIQ